MNSDTETGPPGADALQKLTELVWRAELLVDVEERVEQVTCRGEVLPYDGPSEQVTDWRRQVGQLLALVERPPRLRGDGRGDRYGVPARAVAGAARPEGRRRGCRCAADVPLTLTPRRFHPAFGKSGGVQPMYFAPHLLSMSPASTTSM
ncbi:hypothetical protein [Actinacidiphila yeochonensis]|uniref:hypothetical protein n=1 Tax=Actinacidiphila yeochonensis TaxID=89050 RepID=UPI0012FEFFD3|nr:hypothetical protein [Actinacidiphila yeochonensis]